MQVNAHFYPLTDGARVCVREAPPSPSTAPCIASGVVDQFSGPRDGRWQRALNAVALEFNKTYEFSLQWDALRGGYVAADALLVESVSLYNGGDECEIDSQQNTVVVGPMDSRILIKFK